MGIYYRKRVKLFKGVNINLSKSGPSISVGPRGAKLNFGKNGVFLSTGIPNTGIYMRQKIAGRNSRRRNTRAQTVPDVQTPIACFILLGAIPVGFLLPVLTTLPWWSCLVFWATILLPVACVAMYEIENRPHQTLDKELQEDNTVVDKTELTHTDESAESAVVENNCVPIETHEDITTTDIALDERITDSEAILLQKALARAATENKREINDEVYRRKIKNARDILLIANDKEKNGLVDEAIECYEEVVSTEAPVTLPYDRLPIIYRKLKKYEDEIRILNAAIKVFTKENEKRATDAIKRGSIDFTTAMHALEINECLKDERGIVILSLYNTNKYFDRLIKAKRLAEQNK